jgi:hypothetical protein
LWEQVQGIYEPTTATLTAETYAKGSRSLSELRHCFKTLLLGTWHKGQTMQEAEGGCSRPAANDGYFT